MGVVYKARDVELNRHVAIKVLPASAAADSERRQRFLRGTGSFGAQSSQHCHRVRDLSRRGSEFIAMELVDGKTLDAWLGPTDRDCRTR
ncbi:MAG: hypothetical protein HYR60_26065 [Acidobacteria bacterium]|nr:hypothetical protein [Acidobacteriota bacterium]